MSEKMREGNLLEKGACAESQIPSWELCFHWERGVVHSVWSFKVITNVGIQGGSVHATENSRQL